MIRAFRPLMTLVMLVAMTANVSAQNWARRYANRPFTPMSLDGPVFNLGTSPDYELYVRNPAGYQQLMLRRQQQAMQQEQKAYQKMVQAQIKQQQQSQKAFQEWAKKNPELYAEMQLRAAGLRHSGLPASRTHHAKKPTKPAKPKPVEAPKDEKPEVAEPTPAKATDPAPETKPQAKP